MFLVVYGVSDVVASEAQLTFVVIRTRQFLLVLAVCIKLYAAVKSCCVAKVVVYDILILRTEQSVICRSLLVRLADVDSAKNTFGGVGLQTVQHEVNSCEPVHSLFVRTRHYC